MSLIQKLSGVMVVLLLMVTMATANMVFYPSETWIMFSEHSATVLQTPDDSFSLDFNIEEQSPDIIYPMESTYPADEFLEEIVKSDYSKTEKQFIIWKYLGVEEEALRIKWLKDYGESKKDYEKLSRTELFRKASKNSIGISIEKAIEKGLVEVHYQANGYSSIRVTMYAKEDVVVNIPLGQVFKNMGGQNQNLGVSEPVTVYMLKERRKKFEVKSYCINQHKGVPTGNDKLEVEGSVPEKVKSTMRAMYAGGIASAGESQSLVWADTDGAGANFELENLGLNQEDMAWIEGEEIAEFAPDTPEDIINPEREESNLTKILNWLRFWEK